MSEAKFVAEDFGYVDGNRDWVGCHRAVNLANIKLREWACEESPIGMEFVLVSELRLELGARHQEIKRLTKALKLAEDNLFIIKVSAMSVLDPHATATLVNPAALKALTERTLAEIERLKSEGTCPK